MNLRFACCSFPYFGKSSEHTSAEEAFVKLVKNVTILFQTEEKTVGDLIEAFRISLKPLTMGFTALYNNGRLANLTTLRGKGRPMKYWWNKISKSHIRWELTVPSQLTGPNKTLNIHIKVVEKNVNS